MPRPSFLAYCATVVIVFAIRTYEPWTWGSVTVSLILLVTGVTALILVARGRNR